MVYDGFAGNQDDEDTAELTKHEDYCYLKTKSETYKKHWMVLLGNELYFYRKKGDTEHKVMHVLTGTYIRDTTMDELSSKKSKSSKGSQKDESEKGSRSSSRKNPNYHPLKIVIPPNKSRIIFFSKPDDATKWSNILQNAMGMTNVFEFYDLDKTLGKGQFGLVKLATHKKTK